MKISLITVTYNSEKTLEDTIKSVLAQKYDNLEYIVVDGGSTDGTLSIVKKYLNQLNIKLISEKDKGLYDAMNKGIKLATGDIIGTLNSDDVFYDDNILKSINENYDENTEILYGDVVYMDENLNTRVRDYISGNKSSDYWCPAHPSMYVRKEVFEKIGLYNINYHISADYDFMVRCNVSNIRFKYLKKYFVKMRYGGTSNGLKGYLKNFKECYIVLKTNKIHFPLVKVCIRSLKTILQIIKK